MSCKVKRNKAEPKRKRVLIGRKYDAVDPKPGDLAMIRLKFG